jgi:hypothetical protein
LIMKKFYAQIFIAALLLTGLNTRAQYFSIATNPNNYTFDDPRFWQGELRPPNPCTGCTISILSPVTIPSTKASPPPLLLSTAQPTATSVFDHLATPPGTGGALNVGHDAPGALTVGMRFTASVPGTITGISFWQDPTMSGSHTVGLFANGGGAPLATATLVDPIVVAGNWRTISFGAGVPILAGVTYVAAVYMDNGFYDWTTTGTSIYATGPVVNGVLTGLQSNPPAGANGVYDYSGALTFPTSSFTLGTNYWVDPVFAADPWPLNDVVFNGSTVKVFNNTDLNFNTLINLNGSTLQLGVDASSTQNLFVNDQIVLDEPSVISLANNTTVIDVNNNNGNPITGTIQIGGFPIQSGIYTVRSATPPAGAIDATLMTADNTNYNGTLTVNPYTLNCTFTCGAGLVTGPTKTQLQTVGANNYFGFGQSATLPVVLAQFIATKQSDGSVKLSWTTSQEVNAGYYDVERSGDQSGWTKIGSVAAKGNSTIATDYSLIDRLPLDGTGYYRLKMVDLDGKFVYSKTVTVSTDNSGVPLVIYNNPFTDMIRLKVNVSRAQNLTMTVSDMMGRTYIRQSVQAQAGDNLVNLQPAVIGGSGMYVLRITGDSYDQTAKIEKQ